MWNIQNVSSGSIAVNDIPIPQTILPYQSVAFFSSDVLHSRVLSENIASGALVITNFGSFAPGTLWLPLTYVVHPMASETQSGQSLPFTMGVFSQGTLLLNVSAITGSLNIGYEEYDGTAYYPLGTDILNVTATGPQNPVAFSSYGICGRFVWTLTGTATFSLIAQMR